MPHFVPVSEGGEERLPIFARAEGWHRAAEGMKGDREIRTDRGMGTESVCGSGQEMKDQGWRGRLGVFGGAGPGG